MPLMGVITLVIACLILGGLIDYLLSLLVPRQPNVRQLLSVVLIVAVLIAATTWILLNQKDETFSARSQLPGGIITEITGVSSVANLDSAVVTSPTELAGTAPAAGTDTTDQVFCYFVGQNRTYNYSRVRAVPSADGQVTDPVADMGTFTESTVFIETASNDEVRVVGLEQNGENPTSHCAVDSTSGAIDIWIVTDASRLYQVCSREEAYAIAMDILNEDEAGPTE